MTGPGLISLFCFLMTAAHFLRGGMNAGVMLCMGLAAGLPGRLSPWRMRVKETCTGCTLCRDCISRCSHGALGLGMAGSFSSVPSARADMYFVTLVCVMHVVFLAAARV